LSVAPIGACCALAGLLLGGCGGGTAQNAHEAKGNFTVALVRSSFPAKQAIARDEKMVLTVRNTGTSTVPNVAVSVNSFAYTSTFPRLASNKRPVWIIDEGPGAHPRSSVASESVNNPGGGSTAFVNTWALGALAPGHSKSFIWRVTPVKAGTHTVSYTVAAGLNGKARAQLTGGEAVTGHFLVDIAPKPPGKHVDPNTGKVVPGPVLTPAALP
jgi:hypothetical protein